MAIQKSRLLLSTFLCLLLNLSIVFTIASAQTRGPSQNPVLRIETGMHTAIIRRISVDQNCSLVATASDDKTVRLWSLPQGRLIRTFRLPIGKGHGGKSYAVALSPDGRYLAAGGWDAKYEADGTMSVYLLDTLTGQIVRRLGKFTTVIYHLAYSADGSYLAATIAGKGGMRVWRTSDWKLVGFDTKYKGDSFGATFGPDNSLYTTSYDGYIRKYTGRNFKLAHKVKGHSSKESVGVAVDPTGRKIAIGYRDKAVVDIHDTSDLSYLFTPDMQGVSGGNLVSVAWSEDGRRLYSGGTYWDGSSRTRPLLIWSAKGRGKQTSIPGPRMTVSGLKPCGRDLAIGGADPSIGLMTSNGRRKIFWNDRNKADMRGKLGNHFTISDDGTQVRFGTKYLGEDPVLLDVLRGDLVDAPDLVEDLHKPKITGLKVKNWKHKRNPSYKDKPIRIGDRELSRSLAVKPRRSGFILGASWSLRSYDIAGKLEWKIQAPADTWGVNITRGGEIVVAAFGDGTLRWYRASDGKHLLSFFLQTKDRRWIIWTPKGYYTASPGGEDLIGWHINRKNWDKSADFFPSSRFRERFYRPDIVKLVLEFLDEDDAIFEANRISKRKEDKRDIRNQLPPVINILNPGDGNNFSNQDATIEYDLRSPSGLKVTKVDVLLDGRPIDQGKLKSYSIPRAGEVGKIQVSLPSRNVKLALIAHTKHATSEAAGLNLTWKGEPERKTAQDINKPKLYALLIGVSDYSNADYKLRYAAKDAEDFANTLKKQEGGVYREVVVRKLTNSQATAGNIRDALDWLEGEVTHRDVGLLFLAGHGMTDLKQRFYYLPYDGNPEKLRRTAIPQSDIQSVISSLAGKALMFIDACHSAGSFGKTTQTRGLSLVDVNGIVNELSSAENGVVMFASSTGRQLSIEDSRWENGAFTEALLEGFEGKADYNKNNAISIGELDLWLSERVKQLTNKKQHPVARRPSTVPDFPIAIAKF